MCELVKYHLQSDEHPLLIVQDGDSKNTKHVLESGELGVEFKAEDWVLPDRVSLLIRSPMDEIES